MVLESCFAGWCYDEQLEVGEPGTSIDNLVRSSTTWWASFTPGGELSWWWRFAPAVGEELVEPCTSCQVKCPGPVTRAGQCGLHHSAAHTLHCSPLWSPLTLQFFCITETPLILYIVLHSGHPKLYI